MRLIILKILDLATERVKTGSLNRVAGCVLNSRYVSTGSRLGTARGGVLVSLRSQPLGSGEHDR